MSDQTERRNSALSPSSTWSPHTAALYRRRQLGDKSKTKVLGSLGTLNLDDDDDDSYLKSLTKSPERAATAVVGRKSPKEKKKVALGEATKKAKAKTAKRQAGDAAAKKAQEKTKESDEEIRKSIEKCSPEIKAKLYQIYDPDTPLKERLQIEVDMMKEPTQRKILAEFRYYSGRKKFIVKTLQSEAKEEEKIGKFMTEEAKRADAEEKVFAKNRQDRVEVEIGKREREAKLERDVKVHAAKEIAEGAEELRKDAERTAEAAVRNMQKKVMAEKEKEEMVQNFINGEGQYLTDVQRELKIARMLNEEV